MNREKLAADILIALVAAPTRSINDIYVGECEWARKAVRLADALLSEFAREKANTVRARKLKTWTDQGLKRKDYETVPVIR